MPKFFSTHTVPPGGIKREQLDQLAKAAMQDPVVKGYRSFVNLSEGKIVCVFEGPNKKAIADWFAKMKMPYESITKAELEGERGVITVV